jgi:hypothetical protein
MGEFAVHVNLNKRQCMDAEFFDGVGKRLFSGAAGVAVGYLLCAKAEPFIHPLIGAWAGDALVHAGEFGAVVHSDSEEEWRGLYFAAAMDTGIPPTSPREFTDISQQAIAMLCEADPKWAEGFAEELARRKYLYGHYERILLSYGYAALHQGSLHLRDAIMRHIGPVWLEDYRQVCKEYEGFPGYALIVKAGIPEKFDNTRDYAQEAKKRRELKMPFLLVNLAKRQYLDSMRFKIEDPYDVKLHYGIEAALNYLITEVPAHEESPEFAAARWVTDPVIAVRNYALYGDSMGTTDDRERSLFEQAKGHYHDISDCWEIPQEN